MRINKENIECIISQHAIDDYFVIDCDLGMSICFENNELFRLVITQENKDKYLADVRALTQEYRGASVSEGMTEEGQAEVSKIIEKAQKEAGFEKNKAYRTERYKTTRKYATKDIVVRPQMQEYIDSIKDEKGGIQAGRKLVIDSCVLTM